MRRAIPISKYAPFEKIVLEHLSVFKLDAIPTSSPIDINVATLSAESAWSLSDRLRFWHTLDGRSPLQGIRLTIRKLELEEQALVHCHVEAQGSVTILSNSKDCAMRFFSSVFLDVAPSFPTRKDWKLKGGWVKDETTLASFAGAAAGALGWGAKVPHEIEDSMKEALRGIEKRNWKSCVVMCRRALQALMEVAYEKFFGVKPGKGLDLNGIIRSFEKLAPPPIPRHWLNIADAASSRSLRISSL